MTLPTDAGGALHEAVAAFCDAHDRQEAALCDWSVARDAACEELERGDLDSEPGFGVIYRGGPGVGDFLVSHRHCPTDVRAIAEKHDLLAIMDRVEDAEAAADLARDQLLRRRAVTQGEILAKFCALVRDVNFAGGALSRALEAVTEAVCETERDLEQQSVLIGVRVNAMSAVCAA